MQKKLIIIAKCFESSTSGPANIVRGLINEFDRENIPYDAVLLKESSSRTNYFRQVVRTIRKEKNAIINVHTEGFLIPLLVYLLSLVFKKRSYYLTVHGIYKIEAEMEDSYSNKYGLLERYLYKHFQNLICVSEMLKNDIEEIYGRTKNVIVIPNATEARSDEEYMPQEKREIISLGGLRKCKGIVTILKYSEIIKSRKLPIHISIYGVTENNQEWFENEVVNKHLEEYVEYRGLITNKNELYNIIKKADAQICFSKYDTYNVAIAESLVLGCPCIATNRCGAASLINNGENGYVVNEQDILNEFDGVSEYIAGLDERTRKRIEDGTAYYIELLSWKNIARLYSELPWGEL